MVRPAISPASGPVAVAVVGKYIELPDAYLSVTEALRHAAWANGADAKVRWVNSETLTPENLDGALVFMRDCLSGALEGIRLELTGLQRRELAEGLRRDLEQFPEQRRPVHRRRGQEAHGAATRLRPSRLASYSARSAAAIRSSAEVPSSGRQATPRLTVTRPCPKACCSTTARIRSP